MDYRYKKYSERKFSEWKQRVKKRLPELVITFYTAKLNGKYIEYDVEKTLGTVIREISNPYYSITNSRGELMDRNGTIAAEIMLQILVSEIFSYVKKL